MFKDSFIKRVKTELEQGEKHSDGAAPPETGNPYVLPPKSRPVERRENSQKGKNAQNSKKLHKLTLGRQIA